MAFLWLRAHNGQCIVSAICPSHVKVIVLMFLMCRPFIDSRTLGYEETVIITLATVSVLAVLAVAAFFGYRMMHGELPWLHTVTKSIHYSRLFKCFFSRISSNLINGIRADLFCKCIHTLCTPLSPVCLFFLCSQETESKAFTTWIWWRLLALRALWT